MFLKDKIKNNFNMIGHPIEFLRNRMVLQIYERMNLRMEQNIQSRAAFNVHLTLGRSILFDIFEDFENLIDIKFSEYDLSKDSSSERTD